MIMKSKDTLATLSSQVTSAADVEERSSKKPRPSSFSTVVGLATAISGDSLLECPVARIETNPRQYRKRFRGIVELAESIAATRLLEPIVVRKHPLKKGWFQLIAGERRFRAFRDVLFREKISATVIDVSDEDLFSYAATENGSRSADDDYEFFKGFKEDGGLEISIRAASLKYGKSRSAIQRISKYAELPDSIIEFLDKYPSFLASNKAEALVIILQSIRQDLDTLLPTLLEPIRLDLAKLELSEPISAPDGPTAIAAHKDYVESEVWAFARKSGFLFLNQLEAISKGASLPEIPVAASVKKQGNAESKPGLQEIPASEFSPNAVKSDRFSVVRPDGTEQLTVKRASRSSSFKVHRKISLKMAADITEFILNYKN